MLGIDLSTPLLLSLRVAGLATFFSFVFGVGLAWVMSRRGGAMRAAMDAVCTLPMVLPPTVLGYYLILLVGRRGLIGPWLMDCGINLMFSWKGAVAAATVVVFPLVYKSARAALGFFSRIPSACLAGLVCGHNAGFCQRNGRVRRDPYDCRKHSR